MPVGRALPFFVAESTMYTALVQRYKDAQQAAAAAYLNVCADETAAFPDASQHYRAGRFARSIQQRVN